MLYFISLIIFVYPFQWADCENACQLVKEFPDMQQLLQKFQADLERDK